MGIDSEELTFRIEADDGTTETPVTTASNSLKAAESVDNSSKIVAGGGSMESLRIDAAFSHDILIFLLWVKSLGFDRALLLARTLPSPWPETLAAYEVALVAKGREVVFDWQGDCTAGAAT